MREEEGKKEVIASGGAVVEARELAPDLEGVEGGVAGTGWGDEVAGERGRKKIRCARRKRRGVREEFSQPALRMAADRVRGGYPRVLGPRFSVSGPDFCPWFFGFAYPKCCGFGADL